MGRPEAIAWLEGQRDPSGAWGYLPGQPGRAEPTVLAVAAGLPAPLPWLEEADLGFAELLLPAALARVPEAETLCAVTAERLLTLTPYRGSAPGEVIGHDGRLAGWSWVEGTASWVEPTCYAVLSLRRWGHGATARVAEAQAMLRDRQCEDGGWNYGNPRIYGDALESYLPPTGWACLALPPGPEVERGLERLQDALSPPSTLALALAILARVAHGHEVASLAAALRDRQAPDGSFGGRVDWTALAATALAAAEEGDHVLVLPA